MYRCTSGGERLKTYQDLTALGDNERDRMEFVRSVVRDHLGLSLIHI